MQAISSTTKHLYLSVVLIERIQLFSLPGRDSKGMVHVFHYYWLVITSRIKTKHFKATLQFCRR